MKTANQIEVELSKTEEKLYQIRQDLESVWINGANYALAVTEAWLSLQHARSRSLSS